MEFYVSLFFIIVLYLLECDSTSVNSKVGPIKGLRALDGNYTMYLGIPYAKINKSNPFGESLPWPHFDTEFKAFDDSGICAQQEQFNNTIVGNLDCLHVNIYVPDAPESTKKLAVLVYIYGGDFKIGFAGRFLYGPKYLMEHGIILVTFNYRLGPYGFFCLSVPEVSGNQGMKDQVKALKWIKGNIEAFGGDANKITLDGSSSGATSLDYILHTLKEEDKLFDKIILQSGNVYSIGMKMFDPNDTLPVILANKLGYNGRSLDESLNYLATTDPKLVINASVSLNIVYNACLEKKFDGIDRIPPDYPINLNVSIVKDIPLLIGNNDAESLHTFYPLSDKEIMNLDLFKYQRYLDVNDDDYNEDMKDIVYQYYFGERALSKNEVIRCSSDFDFYYPSKRMMKKYLENGASEIYYYLFTYNGNRNFVKKIDHITTSGATHADELGYLFDMTIFDYTVSKNDMLIIKYMTTLWANFVKYGNPTPEKTDLLPIKWLPYNLKKKFYMNIDLKLKLETDLYYKNMAFWDLFYDINENVH